MNRAYGAPDFAGLFPLPRQPLPPRLGRSKGNEEKGLTSVEADTRRKVHGYNEVAEQKEHPALQFLRKFWGLSAWMLELIMVLSAVLRNYADLGMVSALLVVNAVLGFMQERRAAGVVAALRRRLQVNTRVRRDCELAGHPRPGTGSRRSRSRATRRHHPGGRQGPARRVDGRSIGAHR